MDDAKNFYVQYDASQRKKKLRFERKMTRCKLLHNTFGEKLNVFKFSISTMCDISENDWPIWVQYMKDETDKVFLDVEICHHKIEKGPLSGIICGRIGCDNKKHI
jgi:hypothetical protein